MPHAARESEQTQLVSTRNPLGDKDVPLVRIQAEHVHLDLLPKTLSQQHVHLSRWGVPTHPTHLSGWQQPVEPEDDTANPLDTRATTRAGTHRCSCPASSRACHDGDRAISRKRIRQPVSAEASSRFVPCQPRAPRTSIVPSSTLASLVVGDSSIAGR